MSFAFPRNDPGVAAALAGLSGLVPQPDARPADNGVPHAASISDPGIAAALASVAQIQPARPETQALPNPHGSPANDPQAAAALQAAAQLPAAPPSALCLLKNSLNGGELAPDLMARYDLPRFQSGCEKLLNMIPLPGGGICRRSGFRFVCGCGDAGAVRLVPFQYSTELSFMCMILANAGGSQLYILSENAGPSASAILPYTETELASLSFCQCGKNIYLAHASHPPAKLVFDGQGFTLQRISFKNQTPIPSISGITWIGSWTEGAGRSDMYFKVTAVNDVTGEESLPSPVAVFPNSMPLSENLRLLISVSRVPGCSEYRIYKRKGGEYGYLGSLTDDGVFHDTGLVPDVLCRPPEEFKGFAANGDYPSVVFMHQQRLGWAASDNDPLTIWMSQTSNFECMAAKTPPSDDDAIEVTLASTRANRILWCLSDRSGLAIGTTGEEWYLTGAEGGAGIAPGSLAFQAQTSYGSMPGLAPVRASSSLIFAQRDGRVVRDMGYSFSADRYECRDLTLMATHIFETFPIRGMAWQGGGANILWCLRADSTLAALTYMPDQEICAWHRHETNGAILSIAVLDTAESSSLWAVIQRPEGLRVETLRPLNAWEDLGADSEGREGWLAQMDGQARYAYKARCIPCLPETGMEGGSTFAHVKKLNALKLRAIRAYPFQCQVSSQHCPDTPLIDVPAKSKSANLNPGQIRHAAQTPWDWATPIAAGFRDCPRLELIFDNPLPATILGLAITIEVAREAGAQV